MTIKKREKTKLYSDKLPQFSMQEIVELTNLAPRYNTKGFITDMKALTGSGEGEFGYKVTLDSDELSESDEIWATKEFFISLKDEWETK